MIKDIITYPTPPSTQYATDVRLFNDEIFSIIDDMHDTIEANSLDGLTAFQIGSYYNIVVIKDEDGSFLDLINPRLLSTKGKITTTEKTAYFPGLSAKVTRHDEITVIYQNKEAENLSHKFSGQKSILVQRKIDYTFGSTFLQKLDKDEKKLFETKLEFGTDIAVSESCPTVFHRDKILKVINIAMIAMVITLIVSLFISEEETISTIWNYQLYASL